MGQNIVNCVTWLWGGRLSGLLSLFSHLLLRLFPAFFVISCFSHLLSYLFSLPFSHPLKNLPLAPFRLLFTHSPLILYSSPLVYPLNSYLPTSLFYTSPLRLSSPALWLSRKTDRTSANPLAFSYFRSLMVD